MQPRQRLVRPLHAGIAAPFRNPLGILLAAALATALLISVAGSSSVASEGVVFDDETVYVVCDAGGGVEDVVVVDWLRLRGSGEIVVTDYGDVSDVEAIKDDVDPVVDGSGITWALDLDGERDFFYRAETDKELPLEVDVTYTLDGEEMEPAELAGKAGHLRIGMALE